MIEPVVASALSFAMDLVGSSPAEHRFAWHPSPSLPLGSGDYVQGGAGLGATLAAVEAATGLPTRWATAQFVSPVPFGGEHEIRVAVLARGRRTSQVQATVLVGGRVAIVTSAAVGEPAGPSATVPWPVAPSVPTASRCTPVAEFDDRFVTPNIDIRVVDGDGPPGGPHRFWLQVAGAGAAPAPSELATVGDYLGIAFSAAAGMPIGGASLDNTIRFAELVPTGWVLLSGEVDGAAGGYGLGHGHLWAEDGTFLAAVSQSTTIRSEPQP